MKYTDFSTPTIVAKWFKTTPNNIRRTYLHNKPLVYEAQCIASCVLENGITPKELEYAINNILTTRILYDRKAKKTSRRVPKK